MTTIHAKAESRARTHRATDRGKWCEGVRLRLEPSVCVYTAVADPTTRRQALKSPNAEQWQKAMQEEV